MNLPKLSRVLSDLSKPSGVICEGKDCLFLKKDFRLFITLQKLHKSIVGLN